MAKHYKNISSELCTTCNKNPRRPFSENCAECAKENRLALQRARRKRERAARQPKRLPCKCGCGEMVSPPNHYFGDACRKKGRAETVKRQTEKHKKPVLEVVKRTDHAERFGLRPHRPDTPPPRKPLISEEEQARRDAEASRRDREWHARFMKACLGLESAPGQPLASKVTRPPKEVWKEYEEQYKPLKHVEREFCVPRREDITYN